MANAEFRDSHLSDSLRKSDNLDINQIVHCDRVALRPRSPTRLNVETHAPLPRVYPTGVEV
jgi:hypothetical protein